MVAVVLGHGPQRVLLLVAVVVGHGPHGVLLVVAVLALTRMPAKIPVWDRWSLLAVTMVNK